jgi:hypothetical protein
MLSLYRLRREIGSVGLLWDLSHGVEREPQKDRRESDRSDEKKGSSGRF